jgi:hypothetical protein
MVGQKQLHDNVYCNLFPVDFLYSLLRFSSKELKCGTGNVAPNSEISNTTLNFSTIPTSMKYPDIERCSQTVKWGHESRRSRTCEWLLWRGKKR